VTDVGSPRLRRPIRAEDGREIAGTFLLTIAGTDENAAATGDLDINRSVKIEGKGAGSTIVDGNQLDRVFQVLSGKVSSMVFYGFGAAALKLVS